MTDDVRHLYTTPPTFTFTRDVRDPGYLLTPELVRIEADARALKPRAAGRRAPSGRTLVRWLTKYLAEKK